MAMDTYMSLRVSSPDPGEAAVLRGEIERLDRLFSPDGENSDVARLNSSGKFLAVAQLLHHWNGKASGTGHVGHGAA